MVECAALEQHLFAAATAGPRGLSENVARLFDAHASDLDGDRSSSSSSSRNISSNASVGAGCSAEAPAAASRWRLVFAHFDVEGRGAVPVAALEAGLSPTLARTLGLPSNVTAEGATSLRLRREREEEVWGNAYKLGTDSTPTRTADVVLSAAGGSAAGLRDSLFLSLRPFSPCLML